MKKNIKFLIMDVDGTLTDGKIYMGENGELMKAFDIKDGCGIKDILPRYGIVPVIITARKSKILEIRCDELDIAELYQGIRDKTEQIKEVLKRYSEKNGEEYTYANCAYIGDDILDLSPISVVKSAGGLSATPADAVNEVKKTVEFVCEKNGGNGAVREFIEWIISEHIDKDVKTEN